MDKPIVRRQLAQQDIVAAIDYYRASVSEDVALRFVRAIEDASAHISEFPGAGSPPLMGAPGAERPTLNPDPRLPYRIFYVDEPEQIVIWRVLHPARDLSAQLTELLSGDETE